MSTSLSEDAAKMFTYTDQGIPSLIKIIAKSNTKGIDINSLGLGHGLELEKEILLGAGKFKVVANEMVQDAGRLLNKITMESIPKFENGINNVPADMLAKLHKNEAVIPANMNPFNPNATKYDNNTSSQYNINVTLNGADMQPGDVASAISREMKLREAMNGRSRNR